VSHDRCSSASEPYARESRGTVTVTYTPPLAFYQPHRYSSPNPASTPALSPRAATPTATDERAHRWAIPGQATALHRRRGASSPRCDCDSTPALERARDSPATWWRWRRGWRLLVLALTVRRLVPLHHTHHPRPTGTSSGSSARRRGWGWPWRRRWTSPAPRSRRDGGRVYAAGGGDGRHVREEVW